MSTINGASRRKITSWFGKFATLITSETEIRDQNKKLIALFLSICAIIFGCLYRKLNPYTYWLNPLFFLKPKSTYIEIPHAFQCIFGIIMCAPLYCRKVIPFKSFSPYYCLTMLLNILLLTVVAQFILGPSDTLRMNIISELLILGIFLLWIGMRSIAGLIWIGIFLLAGHSIISNSSELGYWGLLFIISLFFSLFFQANLLPDDFFHLLSTEFHGLTQSEYAQSIRSRMNNTLK